MSQTEEVTATNTSDVLDMSMESYTETQPVSQPIPIPESKIRKIRPTVIPDSDEEDDGSTIRPGTFRHKRMKFVHFETADDVNWWKEMDKAFQENIQMIDESLAKIDKIFNDALKSKK